MAGCRSNYAVLYDSFPANNKKVNSKKINISFKGKVNAKPFKVDVSKPNFENKIKALPRYFPPVGVKYSEVLVPAFKKVSSLPVQVVKQDPIKKAKEKKKRKRRRFWRKFGSNLFIGAFFLGVAIVLTLVHLQSLAALFGLASILFLFFGLKKLFKKRRRKIRNPFQKNK